MSGSVQCSPVGLDPQPNAGELVHLQTVEQNNLPAGVKARDVASIAAEGEALILVENRVGDMEVLPAGIIGADWELVTLQVV